jgi:hypothetical protein
VIGQLWQVVDGEVRVAVDKAERWGASLAILVAAVHHPGALASAQLGTDPADVARAALAEVAELYAVAAIAEGRVRVAKGRVGRGLPRCGGTTARLCSARAAMSPTWPCAWRSSLLPCSIRPAPRPRWREGRPPTPPRRGRLTFAGRRGRSAEIPGEAPLGSYGPPTAAVPPGRCGAARATDEAAWPAASRHCPGASPQAAPRKRILVASGRRPRLRGGRLAGAAGGRDVGRGVRVPEVL